MAGDCYSAHPIWAVLYDCHSRLGCLFDLEYVGDWMTTVQASSVIFRCCCALSDFRPQGLVDVLGAWQVAPSLDHGFVRCSRPFLLLGFLSSPTVGVKLWMLISIVVHNRECELRGMSKPAKVEWNEVGDYYPPVWWKPCMGQNWAKG